MKILIVEDSKFAQMTHTKILSNCLPEAELLVAENGSKGLEVYNETAPSIVITDLLMPILDGIELIRGIRATDKETPIVIISADVQEAVKAEAEALGVQGFINKPLTSDKAVQICNLLKELSHD